METEWGEECQDRGCDSSFIKGSQMTFEWRFKKKMKVANYRNPREVYFKS